MKKAILFLAIFCSLSMYAQRNYGTPIQDELPEKLKILRKAIEVNNFPKTIDPIKIDNQYYWKHNTAILCKESEITIIEFGAYLFYNNTWNLRKSYPLKELNKNFGTKKEVMKQSQPYTWANNWRIDRSVFGGWAMWYFIGVTKKGEKVCGYEKIETTNSLLN
ncbi:hypothetical protein [Aquimarina sp. 2201CG14-23]|uniref:hypothetical protein n=1 Tax=Aquimarina mycalae TaxID=3040073 RepID=UPI002477F836|nr:hypothetical protein [Aquimarina sp. 2201CG14-23]MDH7447956.1 hypothetical protein [Aquimarina sp. 2201CG14-23]